MNINAKNFLNVSKQFQLGHLLTESSHPLTKELSQLVKANVQEAIELLKKVDSLALEQLVAQSDKLRIVSASVKETFESGGKVFLCGCGATGRLSLALETIWRREFAEYSDKVISFMAGGDVALINSIERFEDYPEYGERQLLELRFGDNDLLIGCSEGGETPFVIGAVNAAANSSNRHPFFIYCNPDEQLMKIERSKVIIKNEFVHAISIPVGPMAIAGSTRMQASTVLMLSVGISLWSYFDSFDIQINNLKILLLHYKEITLLGLDQLIELEARSFKQKEFVTYECDQEFGLAVLTDTTERSPTFSLTPFDNLHVPSSGHSFNYLLIPDAKDIETQWHPLLARNPRTLEWDGFEGVACNKRISGFDFSQEGNDKRRMLIGKQESRFAIQRVSSEEIVLTFAGSKCVLVHKLSPLFEQILLKMVLNIHSTLVMGLLDRYTGNIMTWVRPSNYKLIDRVVRYVQLLLSNDNCCISYEEVVNVCYNHIDSGYDGPIVMTCYQHIKNKMEKSTKLFDTQSHNNQHTV